MKPIIFFSAGFFWSPRLEQLNFTPRKTVLHRVFIPLYFLPAAHQQQQQLRNGSDRDRGEGNESQQAPKQTLHVTKHLLSSFWFHRGGGNFFFFLPGLHFNTQVPCLFGALGSDNNVRVSVRAWRGMGGFIQEFENLFILPVWLQVAASQRRCSAFIPIPQKTSQ